MLVSLNWLKQYVHLPAGASAKEVALKLTMSTVEVDGVEEQGKNLEGVVVGKVESVKSHPNADRLKVCTVNWGEKFPVQVVCGGSNVKEGMLVALATLGAKVRWHGEGEMIELKKAQVRGIDSCGMICAASEIGLAERFPAEEEKEILDLTPVCHPELACLAGRRVSGSPKMLKRVQHDKFVGMPLAQALGLNDTIIEIDNKSMTNRPDLWGHYGLARELSAIFSKKLQKYNPPEIKISRERKLEVKVEEVKLCPRYSAVEIKNLKIEESPRWLQDKLLAVGLRPINNIVDITNYVMLDVGEPLHAFDAAALAGDKIIVRPAKEGETFVTLDGGKHKLDSSVLVIADEKKAVALAGIMGGLESGIKETTTRVVLEAANFNPVTIRRAATKLGLRTDASARFEKSLDPDLCSLALSKAVQLILENCPGAVVCSNVADEAHFYLRQQPIETTVEFLNKKIGMKMEKKMIVGILERLGFVVKSKKDALSVVVPSWRATKDISIPEDLVEEVARIYGYDNIKTSLPVFAITPPEKNLLRDLEHRLRNILVRRGAFSEVYNYSFVSAAQINNLGDDVKKYIALDNPLSKEKPYLRRNLLLNLLENLNKNIEYRDEVRLMEIGKIFLTEESGARAQVKGDELLPRQDSYLTAVYTSKNEKTPFWEAKKCLKMMLAELNLSFSLAELKKVESWQHPARTAVILVGGQTVGQIYELHPMVADKFGLEARVGAVDLNLTSLSGMNLPPVFYRSLPLYPEVERDLAIIVDKKIEHQEIVKKLSNSSPLLKKVELFDVYEGEHIQVGFKSLAYHLIFADPTKTLTTEEVDTAQGKIVKILQQEFKAEIRR